VERQRKWVKQSADCHLTLTLWCVTFCYTHHKHQGHNAQAPVYIQKETAFISQKVVTIIWESKRFIFKCVYNLSKICLEDAILLGYDTVLWDNGNVRIQLSCDAVSYPSRILCYAAVRNSELIKYFFQSEKCVSFGTSLVFTNIFF
jgi:hypothetical protein